MLLASFNTHAFINYDKGEWGSGGGNALVCFPEGQIAIGDESFDVVSEIKKNGNKIATKFLPFIDTIEMYDLFEAKKRRGLSGDKPEILEITESESIYEYIDRVAKRFEPYNPILTNLIPTAKDLLPDEKFIHHDYAVKYQNDMGEVTLPRENCIIATVAGQVNLNGRENGFYEVHLDSRLFNHEKFSRQSQATLVLHEYIYALTRKYFNHTDSASTRNVVRFYISYSKQFTEGFIAKSLDELGFNKSDNEDSQVWKNYHYSSTMQSIGLYMEVMHENLKHMLREGIFNDRNGDGTIDDLDRTVDIGYLENWMRQEIATQKQLMIEDLNEQSVVSESTLNTISKKFDGYAGYFNVDFGYVHFQEYIDVSSEKVFEEIYDLMLNQTICTSSIPMPIPTTSQKNQECYEEIELNNIIPRI
jgi:hypothetical protein